MEITAYHLRSLGFRRKRKPLGTEYHLDVPFSYGDWVTIVIARVGNNWVIRKMLATGEYGKQMLSSYVTQSTVDEVIDFAEFARWGQGPEQLKASA